MKANRKILFGAAVLLGACAVLLFIGAGLSALFDRISQGMNEGPEQLLYHTDHAAVLRACQDVLRDPQAAGFPNPSNGVATVNGSQGGAPSPSAALPTTLRNLNFEFMTVDHNGATVYFGGGFEHWGYMTAPPPSGPQVQLLPGLWFWSEGPLPRDSSKFPYYRTSRHMLIAGTAMLVLATVPLMYSRRNMRTQR